MFTCRKELEELMGLKHPRKVLIEEASEAPRAAERFFRGIYSEPEKLRRSLGELQKETNTILELLGFRRSRLREWQNELPSAAREAQDYIKESSMELIARHERASLAEARVLKMLQEQEVVELFPVEEEVLGRWSPDRIVLFPSVIEKIALLLKLSNDGLTKVILVHFMAHELIQAGEDRDKRTWGRKDLAGEGVETLVHYYSNLFYRCCQYKELGLIESALVKYLPAAGRDGRQLQDLSREQVSAAMIFWRRQANLSLKEVLAYLDEFS